MGPAALSPGVVRYQYWFHLLTVILMTILLPNELYSFSQPMYRSLSKSDHVNIVRRYERRRFLPLSLSMSSVDSDVDIAAMKIQDIKAELKQRKVPINDVFEKDELIRRLQEARQNDKQRNESTVHSTQMIHIENKNVNHPNKNILSTPLYFTTMDQGMRVPAQNVNGGIIVEPSSQPYATMKVQIPSSKHMNSNNKKDVSDHNDHSILSLLVDTACTGLVLRPTVVRQYQLPSYDTPVTMQGAAGISQATGLTQLSSFTLFHQNWNNNHHEPTTTVPSSSSSSSPNQQQQPTRTFRSLPAAVQDINGLPMVLDGIIGLSFINQFAAMEFDFHQGMIHFYEDRSAIPDRRNNNNNNVVVVDAKLNMIGSLGIYTVPVYIGGRGPVQMLVDTGASCTLLNWKGVADLGLSPTSKQISRIAIPTGAMGSENVAIQLTHRLHVSSTFQMGDTQLNGIPLSPETRMPIDIGQIPVIDNIPGVGGILGIDALMRCRTLQISIRHPATLTMFV